MTLRQSTGGGIITSGYGGEPENYIVSDFGWQVAAAIGLQISDGRPDAEKSV